MCCPRGCDPIKKSKLREFFASEVITSKSISQLSSGAGWHPLVLSLALFLHLMSQSSDGSAVRSWGLLRQCGSHWTEQNLPVDKRWKGQGWQFKQIRIFKTMKRTCQNSNLNPLWELVVARPTWSLHCVTALALRDRSDRLQSSTPTWSSSFTWWAFTPANLLIYCRLVYLHMWISPVWTLKFGCFTKQRNLFHHHFPLLQPWLKENYSCLFSCLFLWK